MPKGVFLHKTIPLEERFWKNVSKTESCWLWTGGKSNGGYGVTSTDRVFTYAHRASWILAYGDPGNKWVLHKCDTPACVNPNHLFLGTCKDNGEDMAKKGRAANTKLTPDQVREIRLANSNGVCTRILAKQYGVAPSTVWYAASRRNFKHVE